MKDKKHIDKLFKDRFKDFEVAPSPEVWGSIQASLESRKKNRKIIPLFWRVGGVAALLALLFTVGISIYNTSKVDTNVVTTDESKELLEKEGNILVNDNSINNTEVASEEKELNNKANATEDSSEKIIKDKSFAEKVTSNSINNNKTKIAGNTNSSVETTNLNTNHIKSDVTETVVKKDAVAIASEKENISEKTNQEIVGPLNKNEPLIKKDIGISEISKTEVTASETKKEDVSKNAKNEDLIKKQSILDAINEQNALKSDEAVTQEKSKIDNRWEVAPNFAPVYYSSLSSGSSLDPSFSDNSQNGDVNFSYGVQVGYAVSERLSVRTGVSNVDLSYSTAGVELGTGPVSAALSSVNYGGRQTVLTVLDEGTIEAQNAANGGFGNITPKSTNGAAKVIQNISYYEIPVELKYAVLKTKIGVNVIGGVSTMVLGNNDVSVEAGDFSSTLGEANNLSTVSFSTNVGLGVDYKISKKFKFNVEPMFKYQVNPYTDSSVDFQPYYIGVYTGLSYKF